ncbi:MAG: MFS transporter, partial [Gaiellaceae bacterium]
MRRLLPLVSAVVIVDTMLYAALIPLLPHYADRYGPSKAGVGFLASMYALGVLVAGVPAGAAASRFGPKRAVLCGLALISLASLGFAWSSALEELYVTRFVQGLGSALGWAGALSWLAGNTARDRRGAAMGAAIGAAIFGSLLGPVIGAVASIVGTHVASSGVAVVGVLLALWALRFEPAEPDPQRLRSMLPSLREPQILGGLWLMTLPALLFGLILVLVPLRLAAHGFSAVAIGAVWLASAAVEMVVSVFFGHMSDRRGRLAPLRLAIAGSIAVTLALAVARSPYAVVPLTLAAAITFGGFYAPALALLSDRAEHIGLAQGLVFGLMNTCWAVGNALGPAGGGALASALGDALPYILAACVCVATLPLLRRLRLDHERPAVLVD